MTQQDTQPPAETLAALQALYETHLAWPVDKNPRNGAPSEEWEPYQAANRARKALLAAMPDLLAAMTSRAGGDAGAVRWRERWYGSDPQRGSAIVDEAGNLIAYFGGDEETHRATTAAVAAHNAALALPAPVVEREIVPPENGEPDPEWRAIKRAIDQFAGRVPTISKHRALNNAHIMNLVERLDAAGDHEAADTIVWQCWWRALDRERERFLMDDANERIAALSEGRSHG